jgi:2-phospho-L-lactate transferase/gluconeogenesis factor (CofD/UPF0052 family)
MRLVRLPDLDTVIYTLGGLANAEQVGCGSDTFEALVRCGNLVLMRGSTSVTAIWRRMCIAPAAAAGQDADRSTDHGAALGITATILPMTDDRFRTLVETVKACWSFKVLRSSTVAAGDQAHPLQWRRHGTDTPQVQAALKQADAIIIAPSIHL